MDDNRRPRERELVLAPNEFAYVLDTTKGHINCYVGPNKTSLAQTDQPVIFDGTSKRFCTVDLQDATQLFATAPANWYMVLKNPAKNSAHPSPGVSNNPPDLAVGRKVIVPGPASFPLWPGQMVKVIEGHRLQSNQYLVIRIYDPVAAQPHWRAALGLAEDTPDAEECRFEAGETHVIRGTEVSFYLPPSGVEVVPCGDRYVQDAVTLQRLEYCVLIGEDGKKSYLRGERVVFPRPHQHFLERDGQRAFRAIELSEIVGIYVKVIAPYEDEDGSSYREGEELFLFGKDKIYFPREEHAVIHYGEQLLHHAIAIPKGEGRYVLDRTSGEVRLIEGPLMFLPDPRREVLTRRVLSERECRLFYPGNDEVIAHNRNMRAPQHGSGDRVSTSTRGPAKQSEDEGTGLQVSTVDAFSRPASFVPPRMITLQNKYDGAVSIDVWAGFAVQVVDRRGGRRVVVGPTTFLLEYDESLQAITLSTGSPKSADRLLRTAFLMHSGNKVSDAVELVTRDLVPTELHLKYRVSFEGDDASRWFATPNYVQLLVDHASSKLKAKARMLTIRELRASITDLVRDTILGSKPEGGERAGLFFSENHMRVHDVEVLDLRINDPVIVDLLHKAQMRTIHQDLTLTEEETALHTERRREEIARLLLVEREATAEAESALANARAQRQHELKIQMETHLRAQLEVERERERKDVELRHEVRMRAIETDLRVHEAEHRKKTEMQELVLRAQEARVDGMVKQASAFSPHLVETLRRMGDEHLLSSLSENFGELAAIEGRGILQTAQKFLDFMPTTFAPTLRSASPSATPSERNEKPE